MQLHLPRVLVGVLLVSTAACDSAEKREARQILASSFSFQHSAPGRLHMLSPGAFKSLPNEVAPEKNSQGTTLAEMAKGSRFSVGIGSHFGITREGPEVSPRMAEVENIFEGLGKNAPIEIQEIKVDGRRGVLVLTTALDFDKHAWSAMYFGANKLHVSVQGPDDSPATKEICEMAIRSIKFDS